MPAHNATYLWEVARHGRFSQVLASTPGYPPPTGQRRSWCIARIERTTVSQALPAVVTPADAFSGSASVARVIQARWHPSAPYTCEGCASLPLQEAHPTVAIIIGRARGNNGRQRVPQMGKFNSFSPLKAALRRPIGLRVFCLGWGV